MKTGISVVNLKLDNQIVVSVHLLHNPEQSKSNNRFNDGKCDPAGRLFVGTMEDPHVPGKPEGSVYCLDTAGELSVAHKPVEISNGLVWTADRSTMYYIDTPSFNVTAFKFDIHTGKLSDPRIAFSIPEEMGAPDGCTIDSKDNIWIAHWEGGAVTCHDPASGAVLVRIEVPTPRVTSCCFGGVDMRLLLITTARSEGEAPPCEGGCVYGVHLDELGERWRDVTGVVQAVYRGGGEVLRI